MMGAVMMGAVAQVKQRLRPAQTRIDTVARQQFGVGADLGQAAIVHEADQAGALDGRQPVGDAWR